MVYAGWGVTEGHHPLPEAIVGLLQQGLGVTPRDTPTADPAHRGTAPSRLDESVLSALVALLGEDAVLTDDHSRLLRSTGKSTPDLLRARGSDPVAVPDAVVLPADHEQVLALLRECARRDVAVVTFGGGTSVVGGLTPDAGGHPAVVSLDVRRLDRLLDLDETSQVATAQAGLRAPELEALLAERGFLLGHYPQSYEFASIGGLAATRSSGQSSAGYGRFEDLVVGVRVATPEGELVLGKPGGSAAGPDLKRLFLGSEGTLGVITQVQLRVRPLPETVIDEAWRFASFTAGADALRALAQSGLLPTVARLSDEVETGVNLAQIATAQAQAIGTGSVAHGGCLAVTSYEGGTDAVKRRRAEVADLMQAHGAESLGTEAASGWREGRYAAPYLRDALLDAGALVETLETSTSWSGLDALYHAVRDALVTSLTGAGTPPLVMGHISHVYPTGASLYFTVVCASAEDPIGQWYAAKASASDAIVAQHATITHHHAVGTDHKAWLSDEIGLLGVQVLRAVKDALDPAGILNPGKLIP